MRIRSAHACKRASENEHTGRGGEGESYPEAAPSSAARHTAGAACGGGRRGHGCSGDGGGGNTGGGGLRAV